MAPNPEHPLEAVNQAVHDLAKSFQNDQLVTIALEDGSAPFTVQQALLCHASPGGSYFSSALKGDFEESKSKVLRLPGCETSAFELYLYWLVHKELPEYPVDFDVDYSHGAALDVAIQTQHTLACTWVLAEYLNSGSGGEARDNALQDAIVQVLHSFFNARNRPQLCVLEYVIEATSEQSSLRDVFIKGAVDVCRWSQDPEYVDEVGKIPGVFRTYITEYTMD